MLAYTDKNALETTLTTGYAHYFSRTRAKLWKKGETSGNVQKIVEIRVDCDRDTLLYLVKQNGPACHTGNTSCFYRLLKD
jgi:phosphoribosyl-AMP cyclohydrolase